MACRRSLRADGGRAIRPGGAGSPEAQIMRLRRREVVAPHHLADRGQIRRAAGRSGKNLADLAEVGGSEDALGLQSRGTSHRRCRDCQTRGSDRATRIPPHPDRCRPSHRRSSMYRHPRGRRSSPQSHRGCAAPASSRSPGHSTRTPMRSRSSPRPRLGSGRPARLR